MDESKQDVEKMSDTPFGGVPIEITISVGTAKPMIKELLALNEDTVLSLDRSLDEPVDLYVGGKLIGKGELEEIDGEGSGRLGVRVVEITSTPSGE